jgi:hypothetical protein
MTALLIPGPPGDYVIGAVVILVALLIVAFCKSATKVDAPESWVEKVRAAHQARRDGGAS